MLTQAELKSKLIYDPLTGIFQWIKRNQNIAGTINKYNHRYIAINKQVITAHRLAWLYVYGDLLPITTTIYHINENTLDNRIDNLKLIPLLVHDFKVPKRNTLEVWKPIAKLNNKYMVSNHGRIYSEHSHRILSTHFSRLNYERIHICKRNYEIHALVAEAFLHKPSSKHVVNHKNHIPNDNHIDNLEYVTRSENIRHAVKNGRKPGPRTGKRT
jgi:hypothetical protein